jgi:two-component sensor histidine kinase
MLNRISQIPLNPFFQALLVAGIIILLLPASPKKYIAVQSNLSTSFDKTQFIFADLDHDGISERIQTFYNLSGNVAVALVDGIFTIGQWNFRGIYQPESPRLMIGDYNQNGKDEIYIFTLVADSVFLHALEYSQEPQYIFKDRFIAQLGRNLKDPDYLLAPGNITDMTGDGSEDVVFAIAAGHSRQPRNVFIYDILNDSLLVSPKSGAFIGGIILENLDADQMPEITLTTYAASNYNDDPFIYSDTSSWFMILEHNLEFIFEPVEYPGSSGGVTTYPLTLAGGEKRLFVFANYGTPVVSIKKWCITDLNGNILKERIIPVYDPMFFLGFIPQPEKTPSDRIICVIENDGFYELDTNLDYHKISDVKFGRWHPIYIDIDQDGSEEIILLKPGLKEHVIYRKDFRDPVSLDFPVQSRNPLFSVKLNGNKPPQLSVQGDQDWKLFDYSINPFYRYRFLIYLAIYLGILGFILIIRKLYSFQLKKRYETEKKITTLQLSSVKAQMEPHFIMNTINTIGSSIYRQKPDEAYNLLLNFSGMVRSLLLSSDKLTRNLKEELDFVKNYLDLEKNRSGEGFSYEILVDDDVNQESVIPKMIIQLHAENALKHGLLPKKTGGLLGINVYNDADYVVIEVNDNGIGRSAASKSLSTSTGKGMKIISQLFETYNKYNKNKLRQEIIDLFDEEKNETGTQVKLFIPVDFNQEIY